MGHRPSRHLLRKHAHNLARGQLSLQYQTMLTAHEALATIALAWSIAFSATAQEPAARVLRPLLGNVVDANGNNVAGAEVHLSYSPTGTTSASATEHQIQSTDNRGRFRFQAKPCTKQIVWAIGPPNDDGHQFVTHLHWVAPGRPFQLVTGKEIPSSNLTVSGIELWADYAPFKLQLAPGGIAIKGMTVDLDESGSCTLPLLPRGLTTATIIDKHGQPLTEVRIPRGRSATSRARLKRWEVPLLVVDQQGKPIADATIRQCIDAQLLPSRGLSPSPPSRHLWREHGKTDENGKLVASIASSQGVFEKDHWYKTLFTATKDGFNLTHSGSASDKLFFDGKEIKKDKDITELKFTLKKAKPTILRLMKSPEMGFANQPVTLNRAIKIMSEKGNSWSSENLIFNLTTDRDGRLQLPALTQSAPEVIVVISGAGITEFIPEPLRRMTPDRAITLHQVRSDSGKEHLVALYKSATVKLHMLTQLGSPATGAELTLISRNKKHRVDYDGWCTTTTVDSAGRVALQLQPGRWSVIARTKTGIAHLELELQDNETKQASITLKKMASMQGRVVDAAGNPAVGAMLTCHRSSVTRAGKRDKVLDTVASKMNWRWINNTVAQADGKFTVTYLPRPGFKYGAYFRHNNKNSKDFEVTADDSPVTIKIE